jgi:hypothetical protein
MIKGTGFKERDVETGSETSVHVFVDDVIGFTADET